MRSQEPLERRLTAIFAADVAGYSRLMSADEVTTMRTLTAHREVMDRLIAQHRGRIANTAGDSVLAEFPSVVDALQCAVQVQEELLEKNEVVTGPEPPPATPSAGQSAMRHPRAFLAVRRLGYSRRPFSDR
jgi:adenylate cyclase